ANYYSFAHRWSFGSRRQRKKPTLVDGPLRICYRGPAPVVSAAPAGVGQEKRCCMRSAMRPQGVWHRGFRWVRAALLPGVVLTCGCSSMNTTEKGVGIGAGLGAGTGALIGSATHNTGAGALIGAGVGALAGGLTGHAIDESEKKTDAKIAAAAAQARPP